MLLALLEVKRDELLFLAAFEPLDVAFEEAEFLELRLAGETGFAEWAKNFGIQGAAVVKAGRDLIPDERVGQRGFTDWKVIVDRG